MLERECGNCEMLRTATLEAYELLNQAWYDKTLDVVVRKQISAKMERIYGALYPQPTPKNAQHEPPYPGDSTVVFSMRAPDMTAHAPTKLCSIQEPHAIAECGEWNA